MNELPYLEVPIRTVPPRRVCFWLGYTIEIERHARRTTFARILAFDGARIQLKHSAPVTWKPDA